MCIAGVVFCGHDAVPASVLEMTVRPGDSITLCCDCKVSDGVYIVCVRNCSHENQPSLVLNVRKHFRWEDRFSRFKPEKNHSSNSYDLMIKNVSESDEGLYYCGTEDPRGDSNGLITPKSIYRYSSRTTRLTVSK